MAQSSCKRDTKSKSHPGMKLALVRVFSCKQQKSHLLSQNVFLQSIIYPSEEKNTWEQAAFWHEAKTVCYLSTPSLSLRKNGVLLVV